MSVRAWIGIVTGGWGRLKRLVELQEAVEAHLRVLPVAGAQLRDASRQVEQAVAQVGGNFERMVACAREGVNQASQLIGDGGSDGGVAGGMESMLATSRKTLEDLLVRIVADGQVRRMPSASSSPAWATMARAGCSPCARPAPAPSPRMKPPAWSLACRRKPSRGAARNSSSRCRA